MIHLRTLGPPHLEESAAGETTRPISAQPKRLALLAYLARAGAGRFRRRDLVLALFWPESDDEHARSALRQALSYLRRAVGPDAVITRGEDEIAVNPAVVRCDAAVFDAAIAAGRPEEAMALYDGDFLEGLLVSDASAELERWVDVERAKLRHQAARACWSLAESSRADDDRCAASRWGRRAVAFAPNDEVELRRLLQLLDALGDRAGAVEAHDRFAHQLATEYATEPSPETRAAIEAVRGRAEMPDSTSATARLESIPMPVVSSALPLCTPAPIRLTPGVGADVSLEFGAEPRAGGAGHDEPSVARRVRQVYNARVVVTSLAVAVGVLGLAAGGIPWRSTRQVADSDAGNMFREAAPVRLAAIAPPRQVERAAVNLYIQGRYHWNKRGPGLLRSIQLFTAALDADPTFAPAYAGMADAYVQLGYASLLRPDDAFPKARAAAIRALELDSTLAEPHATLGYVRLYFDWNWAAAEREFLRALTLNPSYATGHEWYGVFLAAMGRFDEAIVQERQAQALDPLSTAIAGTAAWVLYYAGRNDEAARELEIALRADSSFALGHFYLGRVEQARGAPDHALAQYGATGPLRTWVPTVAAVGHLQGMQGNRQAALRTLARLESRSQQEYVSAYAIALVHAGLGARDSAFAWLERGASERTHWMVWLRRDPRWAPIRADPRFENVARRLQLPP